MNYWGTLKEVFTNKAFVIIFLFLGGAMSFISCLATKMEQIMCRSEQEYIILGRTSAKLIRWFRLKSCAPIKRIPNGLQFLNRETRLFYKSLLYVQEVVTPFYIVCYFIKWVPTSWTYSKYPL